MLKSWKVLVDTRLSETIELSPKKAKSDVYYTVLGKEIENEAR